MLLPIAIPQSRVLAETRKYQRNFGEFVPVQNLLRSVGTKVLSSRIAVPEDTINFVLEANSYDSVVKYFEPIMRAETARVAIVLDYVKAVGLIGK